MSLLVRKSDFFQRDLINQFQWYVRNGGESVAWRFEAQIDQTIAKQPAIGRQRTFIHPLLQGPRSFRVRAPFETFLIFYRFDDRFIDAWRLMHGGRDLPRRLSEPPESP
ncbi:MAG TPA: type II toxin-antitoxin system RelE/ParE family toxin [Verrucomicrobiae bacterium]|nr:type II toxin-antitoxin system RelE/ParE family toxin [Verrucomicrobiae bacterium]